jgi:hypothetical protein
MEPKTVAQAAVSLAAIAALTLSLVYLFAKKRSG